MIQNKKELTIRQPFLDVLKGICIIMIIITHYKWTKIERNILLFPFWVNMAVPIFMIISGYVYAKSYSRKSIDTLKEAYSPRNMVNKIIRFSVPFIVILAIEIAVRTNVLEINFKMLIKSFLIGGYGPGSYYYPVMIQFVLIFPIIYFVIRKYDFNGLIICGGINAVFEVFQRIIGLNEEIYRLLLFRYILLIAFGCYLNVGIRKIRKIEYLLSFILGSIYIWVVCYTNYIPKVIIYWSSTSFIAGLFVIPITAVLIKNVNFKFYLLEILGKASYNIFLVQMVYYLIVCNYIYEFFHSRSLQVFISIILCLSGGVIFYYIETPVTNWITKRVYKILNL